MKKLYINKKMLRTLKQKGYSINKTPNGKIIEGEQGYIQIVRGEQGVLILWNENSRYCERIYSVWPDRKKIRIKIQENGSFENIIIKADQFCKEYGA